MVVIGDIGESLFRRRRTLESRRTEFISPASYYKSMGFAITRAVGAGMASTKDRVLVIR